MSEPGSGEQRSARQRLPDLDSLYTINADGSRNFLHPADVKGRWQIRKQWIFTILIAIYAVVPWIEIGGHPAILIDIPDRQAYLFGRTYTNQDFYLLFFLLSGAGFTLFVLTALWGRIWCGFACPQTVWLEGLFRRIERWLEGPRDVRIRRNQGPMTAEKFSRKAAKQVLFLAFSIVVAHIFLAYFIPARDLLGVIRSGPSHHMTAFIWVVVMTGILYLDFAWFREQTCLIVCPYGRLQSALIDSDTVIIGYDAKRGEPRSRTNDQAGDCVDCKRCVVVCPTGIDIRNGLQMECVGCANCVDACDEIMAKINRPSGLVRYDSRRGFETGTRRSLRRPRVALYAILAIAGMTVFGVAATRRTSFEARALRVRGMPYTIEEGTIRNLFNIHVQNKTEEDRVYRIEPDITDGPGAPAPGILISQGRVRLEGFADATIPVFVTLPRDLYSESFPISFTVRDSLSGEARRVEMHFLGP